MNLQSESLIVVLVVAAVQVTAALFALRAVRTARTPQGAMGWVVFLIAAPHFAVPVFLFLGHSRYPGYVAARRALSGVTDAMRVEAARHAPGPTGPDGPDATRLHGFEQLAGMPAVSGNGARLLIDGEQTFDAIFAAIDTAERYVLVQFYIIHDDALGRALAARLSARALAGVQVHVLYDALGSTGLTRDYLEGLRAAGVQIRDFHAIRRSRSRRQVNFRNHRKIVVIDGEVGFTGGLNVGDEYMGRDASFGHWRDTHIRLQGPVVAQLQLAFAEDWLWSSGEKLDLYWTPQSVAEDRNALVLATGPSDLLEHGSLYFCNVIGAAERRLWIASPYLVPDTDILSALKLAALSGVDVRLLVPKRPDQWLVWLAGMAYFDDLRAAGVRIFRYRDGFLHQKVVLVDDELTSVGTHNLDNRSCRLNFEVTALLFDRDFAARVEDMMTHDFDGATEVTQRLDEMAFWLRYAAPTARLFAPVL